MLLNDPQCLHTFTTWDKYRMLEKILTEPNIEIQVTLRNWIPYWLNRILRYRVLSNRILLGSIADLYFSNCRTKGLFSPAYIIYCAYCSFSYLEKSHLSILFPSKLRDKKNNDLNIASSSPGFLISNLFSPCWLCLLQILAP